MVNAVHEAHPGERRVGPVVTAADLRAAGVSRERLRTFRRRGQLTRQWRGVDLADTAGAADRLVALAAISPYAVLSGPSSARAHGYDVPRQWVDEITIPLGHPPVRGRVGLRVVSRPVAAEHLERCGDLLVTDGPRTVADLLCRADLTDALWILDQALAKGLSVAEIEARLTPRQRGCRTARALLPLGRPESESPLESRVRRALDADGVPPPSLQHVVRTPTGGFVARLDFAWPDALVALEADGVGWHSAPEPLLADRRRANALGLLGWMVLRVTWADIVRDPAGVSRAVRAALASRRDRRSGG